MNEIKKILIIARYTFVELYKSKVIYNILFLGFGIFSLSYLASEFTFGVPEKIALDFGLGALSLSAIAIAIFMGSNLVFKEIENRTVYMVLVRPLNRYSFIVGKILGMQGILALNILILALMSLGGYLFLGGEFSSLIIWSIAFSFLEAAIVLLVVIFFSLITNTVMAIIYAIAIFISGHAVTGVINSPIVKGNDYFETILKFYFYIFPNFSKLNLKDYVIYKQNVELDLLIHALSYGVLYLLIITFISTLIFNCKNLD